MKNEITLIKISNLYMNNKLISENTFQIQKNLSEEDIFKLFGKISSLIDIRSGYNKAQCSRTTLEIINIKKY